MAETTYQARRGADAGSLVLGADQLCFTPKKGDALTIPWNQITKYQPNPPKNAKAMIKIVSQDGESVTFQLKNRTILHNLQEDITKRIKSNTGDESDDDGSDQSLEEGENTVFSDVVFMSTTGSVTLTDETLMYKPNEKGKSLRIGLSKVTKHQASPPKIAKAMLKLILKSGKNHTFQLKDRDELKRFQDDVAKRIEKLQKDDSDDDSNSDEAEDSLPSIPKRIESEDSEDAEEEDEENIAEQSKGETSKEHSPAQEASESPKEGHDSGSDDSDEEAVDDDDKDGDGMLSGSLGGLIAMGDAGEGADGSDSGSEHMEEAENEDQDLFMKNAAAQSDEDEEEDDDLDNDDDDNGAPDMDDSIDSLKEHNDDDNDDNMSGGSVDSFDELPEDEHLESDVPNEDIDMDAYAEAAADYEEDSDNDAYSDEGEMAQEGEVYSDEEDMEPGGEVYSDEDGQVYSDEDEMAPEGEVYSDGEDMALEEGEAYSDEEGDYDDDEMIEGEPEMSAEELEMGQGDDMEGSSENFDIVDEEEPMDARDAIIEEEEGDLDSDEGDEQYDDEEEEEGEEEEEEEEQMESLLAGGDETDDEDLDDFDVLAGKGIRAEGEHSDEEGDYDEPQTRLRRHDEYIEDDEPVGTGSDEESTPFFDDDNEDSFNDFGGVLDRGTLPQALKTGAKPAGGGSMGHDSVSSEETLSLSGLTGVASISSKSEDYDSEEDDDRSRSDSGSESSSGSEEDSSDYSDEEESDDSYTDSDSSDTASFEDDSDYSDSESEESSEESESDSDSYEDFDDYSDEESEEEDVEDYQDPASAWLAFSEDQDEQAFPEMQSKAISKKKKKKKKNRDSYSEGYEKEFSSDDEEEEGYSDDDYSDEIDDYSDERSEVTEESEHSMELELDIEDLTVDDLETALVTKLSAEIGDSAGAQEAVQKMLSTIREDLMQGVEGSGKTTKPEHPGMSEDFYDWAKVTATKVIRKESSRNLMANMNDKEPMARPKPMSTLPPVMDEDLFFDWKKFAKKNKKAKSAEPPPGNKTEEEKAKSAEPPPGDSKADVTEGDKSEPVASEGATTKAGTASKGIDPSLPLEPYDDAMVEKYTERPRAEDPEVRWFNWKKFRKARLPKPVGAPVGTPPEPPSFNWKKYAKKQRKLEKKKANAGTGEDAVAAGEEKKSDEEQSDNKTSPDTVTNGVELLKRLIGTKEEKDRSAMLNKYLAPPDPPDKTEGHVPPNDLLEAISKFVDMIRTAKQSDNAPEITLAQQIAIVARLSIVDLYGDGSDTLSNFEQGLAPVFAPKFGSAEE